MPPRGGRWRSSGEVFLRLVGGREGGMGGAQGGVFVRGGGGGGGATGTGRGGPSRYRAARCAVGPTRQNRSDALSVRSAIEEATTVPISDSRIMLPGTALPGRCLRIDPRP